MASARQSFKTVSLAPKDIEVIEVPESVDDRPVQTRYAFVDEKRSKRKNQDEAVEPVASELYVALTEVDCKPENVGEWADYAFLVRRTFDEDDRPRSVFIDIQSPELQETVGEVFWETCFKEILQLLPSFLYARLPEFVKAWQYKTFFPKDASPESTEHLKLLIDYIHTEYATQVSDYVENIKLGKIKFSDLSCLFRADQLILKKKKNDGYQLLHCYGVRPENKQSSFSIWCSYVVNNGTEFKASTISIKITSYEKLRDVTSLPAYPLEFHPDKEKILDDLRERGRKYSTFTGVQFKSYRGMDVASNHIDGRIIIDHSTHYANTELFNMDDFKNNTPEWLLADYRITPSGDKTVNGVTVDSMESHDNYSSEEESEDGSSQSEKKTELKELDDMQLALCSDKVHGWLLETKETHDFFVSKVSDIEWNTTALGKVMIPELQKSLLLALLQGKLAETETEHDIIKGKGNGFVGLLHGAPGVGKTLTVEAIAEYIKVPLYRVSAAELGSKPKDLETNLSDIFKKANRWGAVVLLDEADIFLEQRSLDVIRSQLVTIFLRELESFHGIFFMTTNRVGIFDKAIHSRINVALKYKDLNEEARRAVWRTFLPPNSLRDTAIKRLAKHQANGREIKNCVRTASIMANYRKETLGIEHLETVLNLGMQFSEDCARG